MEFDSDPEYTAFGAFFHTRDVSVINALHDGAVTVADGDNQWITGTPEERHSLRQPVQQQYQRQHLRHQQDHQRPLQDTCRRSPSRRQKNDHYDGWRHCDFAFDAWHA